MNKQAIRDARRLGYLVVQTRDTGESGEWLRIAREEEFPFVVVVSGKWKGPTGFMGKGEVAKAVMWETVHLWPAVSEQAREYVATVVAKYPGVKWKTSSDAGAMVGILPIEEAEDLAKRIVGLTGYHGVPAR